MMKQLLLTGTLSFALPALVCAGGELNAGDFAHSPGAVSAESTRAHIAALNAGLYSLEMQAAQAAHSAILERKSKVVAVQPVQDRFGDPMYTHYGPLPVSPGTPMYDGPRYAASFDRGYMVPMPDGNYRGYLRGRYSQPGIISRTDVVLGTAANNSYMQHGMQVAPGSMAPSSARVMINNP